MKKYLILSFFCMNLACMSVFAVMREGGIVRILHKIPGNFYSSYAKISSVIGNQAQVVWFQGKDKKLVTKTLDIMQGPLFFDEFLMELEGNEKNYRMGNPPIPVNDRQTGVIFDRLLTELISYIKLKDKMSSGPEKLSILNKLIDISQEFSNETVDFRSPSARDFWSDYFRKIRDKMIDQENDDTIPDEGPIQVKNIMANYNSEKLFEDIDTPTFKDFSKDFSTKPSD